MKNKIFFFSSLWLLIGVFTLPEILSAQQQGGGQQQQQQQQQQGGQTNDMSADPLANNVEELLIDFSTFEDKIVASEIFPDTGVDRNKAYSDLTKEDLDPYTLQPRFFINASDFEYKNWDVKLNSSANNAKSRTLSYAQKVELKQAGDDGIGSVLGVRIYFPNTPFAAHAEIMPPYEIPTYDKHGEIIPRKASGKGLGIIDNVGIMKRISIDVGGRNYKHGISIRLKNHLNQINEYFMGYTYFASWRKLNWENPEYDPNILNTFLWQLPLYPNEFPFQKFHSIAVYRHKNGHKGDFVIYFKKINIWFDYSVPNEVLKTLDIDDEKSWGIIKSRAEKYIKNVSAKNAHIIEMKRLETIKKKKVPTATLR